MFTGIVQGQGILLDLKIKNDFQTHVIAMPAAMLPGLTLGASVAHNGCCLTVTAIDGERVSFDLMQETLKITNLGDLKAGDLVNLERAARFGDDIGGHAMSGHIMAMSELLERVETETNTTLRFSVPEGLGKFLFTKGYIGIDGISLTLGAVTPACFSVHLIPETLARTNLGTVQPGYRANIEVDPQTQAIVETVERVMSSR
ncbi:riboflavin synthase subunit alpha [Oceanimonas baumannii]|uniref:Riboflavin synthase n=1 Tax=Oceanimonas baumannii TaxID=129578 RepID=A0A235CI05_9GAMM|nr:riboflavin synthase subunit alpha [Oceanimonas baumannii]OYD24019.1 riboflavin synthase [Oceanimonas baumannii]TDW58811.1 riboflavin synthase alpha chain [Oceanimonas baumannii]